MAVLVAGCAPTQTTPPPPATGLVSPSLSVPPSLRPSPLPIHSGPSVLDVNVIGPRLARVVIGDVAVVTIDCGQGWSGQPGRFGVPDLPWELRIEADGDIALTRQVTADDLPLYVLVYPGGAVADHQPIPGPFVPCPSVPGGIGP